MDLFSFGPISQILVDSDNVYAFQIEGHVDDDASEAMAKFMNGVFDQTYEINMLLDLRYFTGSDWDSMLDLEVIKSRFRSLNYVRKYAVIGAPDKAAKMIELMDKIIPVDARAFDISDEDQAWDFVGAAPVKES